MNFIPKVKKLYSSISKSLPEFEPTENDLQQLREWLKKMPHICQHYNDQFLAAFVRAAKGSLQKTKIVLENFNAIGIRYRNFYGTLDPLDQLLQKNLIIWNVFPLPKKTPDGSIVFYSAPNSRIDDIYASNVSEYCRYALLTLYVLMWENKFGSGQVKIFFDGKGCSLEHCKSITPMVVKQILSFTESAIPIRVKSANCYNMPSFLEHLFNLFKIFAKNKLANRINIYSGVDHLTEDIPREILPKEYGGCEESINVLQENWKKKVESYRERFLEEERLMRSLDHLRPRADEEDEMVGTFRQLNVD